MHTLEYVLGYSIHVLDQFQWCQNSISDLKPRRRRVGGLAAYRMTTHTLVLLDTTEAIKSSMMDAADLFPDCTWVSRCRTKRARCGRASS